MNAFVAASAATATAVPVVIAPAMAGPVDPMADAELLRLGAEFEAAWREVAAAEPIYEEMVEATQWKAWERVDPDGNLPEDRNTVERWVEAWKATSAEAGEPYRLATERYQAATEAVHKLIDDIGREHASSIAGFAVKARAAMYLNGAWWEEQVEDLEPHQAASKRLIVDLCSAAGVQIVPPDGGCPN